mgnify:CR=1 FL=1
MADPTHTTEAQRRLHSEDALKQRFNVNWLLFSYDGHNQEDHPGKYNMARHHPKYRNCRRCHLMGPRGKTGLECDTGNLFADQELHVLVLAQQKRCDTHKHWYNPKFLHNTNSATKLVDEPFLTDSPITLTVHK